LPRVACHLCGGVKLNNKAGNELFMVHALFPVFLLPVDDQLSATAFIDSSPLPSEKDSKAIGRSVAIEKAPISQFHRS